MYGISDAVEIWIGQRGVGVGGGMAYIVDSIQEDCNCETSCSDLIAYARQN
jgi:hypothetical protein